MRGNLILSDDFVSEGLFNENAGTNFSASFNRGLILAGAEHVSYPVKSFDTGELSIVMKFNMSQGGLLFTSTAFDSGNLVGLLMTVSVGLLTITHYLGTVDPPEVITIEADLLDSDDHILTYSLDNGDVNIFIDDSDVVTSITTVPTDMLNETVSIGTGLIGTIDYFRVFETVLDADDHSNYYNNTLSSFMKNALATWRCDAVGDDTNGNKIWDKQPTVNDLYKGDKSDSDTFPTFDTDKYSFDFVDDYVSNIPTLPDDYTVSAAVQNPYAITSEIRQENDETLLTLLSTSGLFWGYLRNMILHSGNLTALQLLHTQYMQLYYVNRGYATGLYTRLITEGTGKVALVLGSSFFDWARSEYVTGTGITQTDAGVTFDNANSGITIDNSPDIRFKNGSIAIHGIMAANPGSLEGLISKGDNYKLFASATTVSFNGSSLAYSFSDNTQLAVTWRNGYEPRFYIDGAYIGAGANTIVADASDANKLRIGNNVSLNASTSFTFNHVYIGDEPLTDAEVLAMHNQSRAMSTSISDIVTDAIIDLTMTTDKHDSINSLTLDASGNGHDGALNGVVKLPGRGYSGTGVDYIEVADATQAIPNGDPSNFTMAALYNKTANNTGYDFLMMRGASGSRVNVSLTFPSDTTVAFSGGTGAADISVDVSDNKGTHSVIFTYEKGSQKLYFDGVLVGSKTDSGAYNIANSSMTILNSSAHSSGCACSILDSQVFDRTMTTAQVEALHDNMFP
ncbi:hypothetical protein KAR91_53340 [Candidatus Pacearchaeota archaeon]|nr:hypothetical protein [Candidatus Pacearchaeota archaeon]